MNKPHDDSRAHADTTGLSEADTRILKAVRDVKYGSVEVTIHHGRVVQVERREKIRLSGEDEKTPDTR